MIRRHPQIYYNNGSNITSRSEFEEFFKGDISKKTFRDIERAFLNIKEFKNENILLMSMCYGNKLSTPPQYGQDTPLSSFSDSDVFILTDKSELVTAKPLKSPFLDFDASIISFLQIGFNLYNRDKLSEYSWHYIDRQNPSKYVPINISLIREVVDKYADKMREIREKKTNLQTPSSSSYASSPSPSPSPSPSSSYASGGPSVSNEYSADEIKIIKGNGDIDLFKVDINNFYVDLNDSNRFFRHEELGERIMGSILEKSINIKTLKSFDELFSKLKIGGPPVSNEYSEDEIKIIKGDGNIDLFKVDIDTLYEGLQTNRFSEYPDLGERIMGSILDKSINIETLDSFDELFRELKKGGKLKKTRRKSKRRRGRKTKMRRRR